MNRYSIAQNLFVPCLVFGSIGCSDDDAAEPIVNQPPPIVVQDPECTQNSECEGATPVCNTEGLCVEPPRAGELGWGDETPESVTLTEIFASNRAEQAVDLEFASDNELWVLHRYRPDERPCERPFNGQDPSRRAGCATLEGSTTTIMNPGTAEQTETHVTDYNSWHFMRRPPAIAWGEAPPGGDHDFFATCSESRTGNFFDDPGDFVGPSLWTSNPEIYRNWTRDTIPLLANGDRWNGSHMDMLHQSPHCTGIAHDAGNAYWVVNGMEGSLDWYDFNEDHGPGEADHSDGEVLRYASGTITRVPNVPGHVAYHDGIVYVADTGGRRIIAFDPSGALGSGAMFPIYDGLQVAEIMEGGTLTELVTGLEQPSGLEIYNDIIYVSDHATSIIHAFELDGTPIRTLDTGLPEGSLAGLAMSPSGKMHFVDVDNARVFRIDPK